MTKTFNVFLLVDSAGNYSVNTSAEDVMITHQELVDLHETDGHRIIKISVVIPLPTVATVQIAVPGLDAPSASAK